MSSVRRTFAKLRDRFRAQGAKRLRNNDRRFDIPTYFKRIFRQVIVSGARDRWLGFELRLWGLAVFILHSHAFVITFLFCTMYRRGANFREKGKYDDD